MAVAPRALPRSGAPSRAPGPPCLVCACFWGPEVARPRAGGAQVPPNLAALQSDALGQEAHGLHAGTPIAE